MQQGLFNTTAFCNLTPPLPRNFDIFTAAKQESNVFCQLKQELGCGGKGVKGFCEGIDPCVMGSYRALSKIFYSFVYFNADLK